MNTTKVIHYNRTFSLTRVPPLQWVDYNISKFWRCIKNTTAAAAAAEAGAVAQESEGDAYDEDDSDSGKDEYDIAIATDAPVKTAAKAAK
jgi:hypothetical protein